MWARGKCPARHRPATSKAPRASEWVRERLLAERLSAMITPHQHRGALPAPLWCSCELLGGQQLAVHMVTVL